MMKKLMIVATLMGAGALFAEDAYIASSTTNAKGGYSISTGYLMKEDTCFVADFEFLARTADASPSDPYQQFVFETANAAGNVARIYINGSTGSGALAWNLTKENVWSTTSQTMTPGKRYKMTLDGYHRNAKLEIDGVQQSGHKDLPAVGDQALQPFQGEDPARLPANRQPENRGVDGGVEHLLRDQRPDAEAAIGHGNADDGGEHRPAESGKEEAAKLHRLCHIGLLDVFDA